MVSASRTSERRPSHQLYDDAPIYIRALGLVGSFVAARSKPGPAWRPALRSGTYGSTQHPRHVVEEFERGRFVVIQRPSWHSVLPQLEAAARSFGGHQVRLASAYTSLRALRVPLRPLPHVTIAALGVSTTPTRCEYNDHKIEFVGGAEIELRLTHSFNGKNRRFYAEAFVGRHVDRDGEPRALFYPRDARTARRPLRSLAGPLADALVNWVADLGRWFELDRRPLKRPRFAIVHEDARGRAYEVQLHCGFSGTQHFVTDPSGTKIVNVRSSEDVHSAIERLGP